MICSIDGCDNEMLARGWCSLHYARWRRHGDPLTVIDVHARYLERDVMERIRERIRVDDVTGCWEWLGAMTTAGYGLIRIANAPIYVHRASYEYLNGAVPSGTDLHHLCRARGCCNPEHVAPIDHAEHARLHQSERAS